MEGWGWERVHDPAVLPDVKELWQQSLATGQPFEMVFPLRSQSGEFRRFLTRVNPVRDSRGSVVQWFGTGTDVEHERRAAEAIAVLRQREQMARQEAELQKRQLNALFTQAPMLIAVLRGPDHVIELANPPICQLWGRREEELVNRSIFDVLPDLGTVELRGILDGVYRTGVSHLGAETPVTIERPSGATENGYVTFVYAPFRTIDGAIDGIFVIASDVTTLVVARQQVNALREAAEAANRAKDEFLAMLGHELRNPLSPILTALQLMRLRGGDGSRARAHRDRAPGQPPDPARRRPARRVAHRARQGRAEGGSGRDRRDRGQGARGEQPDLRAADARAGPRRAAARSRGARRFAASQPGGVQPADQRRQVHATRRPRQRRRPRRRRRGRAARRATPASAWRRRSCRTCSICSCRSARRSTDPRAAWASGSRSCAT